MNQRPNIIMIMTDQQRYDTIKAAGFPFMRTPNMDRLINQGTLFEQAFCPGATCVASRAAIFTGMYPHNTGVYSFDNWSQQSNFVKELNDGGYYCVNLGKMHVNPLCDDAGFHERRIVENKASQHRDWGSVEDEWGNLLAWNGVKRPNDRQKRIQDWLSYQNAIPWEYEDKLHSDCYVGDISRRWLEDWNLEQPLFLEIGFPGPHEPYDPPQKYIDMYKDIVLPKPVYKESELDEKPLQQKALQYYFRMQDEGEAQIEIKEASEEDLLRMRKHYYANVTLIDEKIGEILDVLEEKGILDNTVIIFTTDHGDNLGDHRLPYKWVMYDSVVHVPLIICDFRKDRGDKAKSSSSLVNLIDIGPTVLDYAGINIPAYMEGSSLVPIIKGEEDVVDRSYVFCEDNYQIMMRSATHKLVYYIDQDYGEFYNLVNDPDELDNLFDNPFCREILSQYKSDLLGWFTKSTYFNGRYKTSGERDYVMRWPENTVYGPYLHGNQKTFGTPE